MNTIEILRKYFIGRVFTHHMDKIKLSIRKHNAANPPKQKDKDVDPEIDFTLTGYDYKIIDVDDEGVITVEVSGKLYNDIMMIQTIFAGLHTELYKYIDARNIGFDMLGRNRGTLQYSAKMYDLKERLKNVVPVDPNAQPQMDDDGHGAIIPINLDLEKFVEEHPFISMLRIDGEGVVDLTPLGELKRLDVLTLFNAKDLKNVLPPVLKERQATGELTVIIA